MRVKILIYILFFAALISCKSDNEDVIEVVSSEQTVQHISNELKGVIIAAVDCMMSLDADSLTTYFSKDEFAGFAGNGLKLRTFEETRTVLKYMYGGIVDSKISLSNEQYMILSESSALFSADFLEELTGKNERVSFSKGVFTFVLTKIDDRWMIVHIHISSYPYKKVN